MNGLCLMVAGVLMASLPGDRFDLVWRHSVEKIYWRETWAVDEGRLRVTEAAVRGSGAGMEPPPDAVWVEGEWRYRPHLPPLGEVTLARSAEGGDWWLCDAAACRTLDALVPGGTNDPVVMKACP